MVISNLVADSVRRHASARLCLRDSRISYSGVFARQADRTCSCHQHIITLHQVSQGFGRWSSYRRGEILMMGW